MSPLPIIAAVTIGQSPRDDVVPEMAQLAPEARWIEAGALDDLDDRAIAALGPGPGDFPLVTRLRDGRATVVGEHAVTPRMQDAIRRVEAETDLVVVLCTGEFAVDSRRPLLCPGRVLASTVAAVHGGRPITVLTPLEDQIPGQRLRWRERGADASIVCASPYGPADFQTLGARSRDGGAALIVMDCLGYTLAMKAEVARASGLPTLLARSIVARVAAELLAR
jgi:protein AroM